MDNSSLTNQGFRRLQRAMSHVEKMWIPVNPELLSLIHEGLEDGRYDLDLDFLVGDIKSDIGLFSFCVRRLAELIERNGDEVAFETPIELFRWAGIEKLKQVLLISAEVVSTHELSASEESQRMKIAESLQAASTVEALSENSSIDPELGFSTTVLRQLGILLIAYNYPTVYRRALGDISEEKSVDIILSESLGFSPILLAASLLRSWGLPDWWAAPELSPEIEGAPINTAIHTLAKLQSVGEALARANNPETYPSALRDWEFAKEEIFSCLGPNGLSKVRRCVESNCRRYKELLPDVFNRALSIDAERSVRQFSYEKMFSANPALKSCGTELQAKISEVYSLIQGTEISGEAIKLLLKEVIPFLGFTGGIVYTVDPGAMQLVPRAKFGHPRLLAAEPVSIGIASFSTNPISLAFECTAPIIENEISNAGVELNFIAGSLGEREKAGVLYLEIPRSILLSSSGDLLHLFKILRRTLEDTLQLN